MTTDEILWDGAYTTRDGSQTQEKMGREWRRRHEPSDRRSRGRLVHCRVSFPATKHGPDTTGAGRTFCYRNCTQVPGMKHNDKNRNKHFSKRCSR